MNQEIGQRRREAAADMERISPHLLAETDQEVRVIHMVLKQAALPKGIHILAEIQILRLRISQDKNVRALQGLPQQTKPANQKQAQQEAVASQRRIQEDLTQLKRTIQSQESP